MDSLRLLWDSINWSLLLDMLSRVLAVLVCLTVHETCHGLAAYALGDPTAKRMHRLSFNPLRHIDWFGLLAMIVVGFGWAKPVPVDSRYFKKPKQGMALCALAGPVSNFLLAVLALFGVRLMSGVTATSFTVWLFNFLILLAILNLGLGLFNLIPIPPLDGSKVLFSVLPDHAYAQLMRYEKYGMLVILALVVLGIGGSFLNDAILWVFQGLWNLIVL